MMDNRIRFEGDDTFEMLIKKARVIAYVCSDIQTSRLRIQLGKHQIFENFQLELLVIPLMMTSLLTISPRKTALRWVVLPRRVNCLIQFLTSAW